MSQRQRGLRHELSVILGVDQVSQQFTPSVLPPPNEQTSSHLGSLITRATKHQDEARIVYSYLPALMFRIFGYEIGQGWLETCSELPSRERDAIVALVFPDGPIHRFCIDHTRKRTEKADLSTDMQFEFPRINLPTSTDRALGTPDASSLSAVSYLAPLLKSSLRDPKDKVLLLSPLDYFFLCMVASPTRKWVASRGSNTSVKLPKRSRSLPSIRAQYNQIISAYAAKLKGSDRVDAESLFIPACLDFMFLPWVLADSKDVPRISTSCADAVASLLLTLAPPTPDTLDLDSDTGLRDGVSPIDLQISSNSSALYRHTGKMLESVFTHFTSSIPIFPLIAYVRVLAIYIAPWRGNVHAALKAMLFPKPRPPPSTPSARSPSMSAISSTLSSINAHLPSSSGSPTNVTSVKEAKWRSDLRRRQQQVDAELLRKVVVLAANKSLVSAADGGRVLTTLAEAAHAGRISSVASSGVDVEAAEELQLCLNALQEQKLQMERRTGRRERNFVSMLGGNLGIKLERGSVLSGITEMVHAGSTSGMAGMVHMVSSVGSGTPGSLSKRKMQAKRTSAIFGKEANEVPFFGSVWDRPIAHGENETLVLMAYWLALRLEPVLGRVPDTRFLGQYWVWVAFSFVSLIILGIRHLLLTIS